MNRRLAAAVLGAAALVLAACGGDDTPSAEPDAPDTEDATDAGTTEDDGSTEDATGSTVVTTASSDLGAILVDGEGRTLYLFDNDAEDTSNCSGDCATTWPPLTGEVSAEGDVDTSLLGMIERDDGSTQVTYDGRPLYYYAADTEPGDVNGQGVGDVWWVIGPDGSRITSSAAAEAPAYDDGPY